MPKYFYKCRSCEETLEFYHSMSEKKNNCTLCGKENTLYKIPSSFTTEQKDNAEKKTGDLVKEIIKQFQEELEEQKDNLKNEYI